MLNIRSEVMEYAKKVNASGELSHMTIEDYTTCVVLLQMIEDELERQGKEEALIEAQDAEISLRERFSAACRKYLDFKEEEKRSDLKAGMQEYGNLRMTFKMPVREESLIER